MSNTVYENKVIASKATDLLLTQLNARTLMTIDTELSGTKGMIKTINTYTYSGEAENLAQGVGSTAAKRGSVTYVGKDYTIELTQQAFDYFDEEIMKDPQIVDVATKGAMQVMANWLTGKFYGALDSTYIPEGETDPVPFVDTVTMAAGKHINYDIVVDAISAMNTENEANLFLLIPNSWKGYLRKDSDFKAVNSGEIILNGHIGSCSGLPVIATKALDAKEEAFVLSREAVTLFLKKNVEVEQDRNKDTRQNSVYLREYFVAALTDASQAMRIVEHA